MAIQEATNSTLWFAEEVTFGVDPNNSTFHDMRFVSENLEFSADTKRSAEISGLRQSKAIIRMSRGVSGSIETEFGYQHAGIGAGANLFEGLMMSPIGAGVDLTGKSIDVAAGTYTATWTDAGTSGAFTGILVGTVLKTEGMAGARNNGIFRVISVTDTNNVITDVGSSVTESGATGVRLTWQPTFVGSIDHSYTFKKKFADTAPDVFFSYLGCMVESASFSVAAGSEMKVTWNIRGQDCVSAATVGSATLAVVKGVREILRGVDIGVYPRGNSDSAIDVSEINWTVTNALRPRNILGTELVSSFGLGTQLVEGTMKVYFEDIRDFTRFTNHYSKDMTIKCEEPVTGGIIAFDFPAVKVTSYKALATGENDDVFAEIAFSAYEDDGLRTAPAGIAEWTPSVQVTTFPTLKQFSIHRFVP